MAIVVDDVLQSAAKEFKDRVKFSLGAATIAGSRVHSVTFPPDTNSPFADGSLHLVITNEIAAAALGGDSLAAVRKVLESRAVSGPAPIALRVKLSNLLPILPADSKVPEEVTRAAFAEGKDEITLQVSGQDSGAKIRLEVRGGSSN